MISQEAGTASWGLLGVPSKCLTYNTIAMAQKQALLLRFSGKSSAETKLVNSSQSVCIEIQMFLVTYKSGHNVPGSLPPPSQLS